MNIYIYIYTYIGSFATRLMRPGSDIDLVVSLPQVIYIYIYIYIYIHIYMYICIYMYIYIYQLLRDWADAA